MLAASVRRYYTSANTRRGFVFRAFGFNTITNAYLWVAMLPRMRRPAGGRPHIRRRVHIHTQGFFTSGVCYTIIHKDLITDRAQSKAMPALCTWLRARLIVFYVAWLGIMLSTASWLACAFFSWVLALIICEANADDKL